MYRLVMNDKKGLRIGMKQYTKENAEQRARELAKIGIQMRPVSEEELFS